MKASITKNKALKIISVLISAVFWTALWEFLALAVDRELLLPSPVTTAKKLFELAGTLSFWKTAGMS